MMLLVTAKALTMRVRNAYELSSIHLQDIFTLGESLLDRHRVELFFPGN